MPKKAMDYSKCLIYKLVSNDLDVKDCYVGHTTNFKQRKSQHKSNCNNPISKKYNYKVYQFIRENGGWTNWSMVLVENYPCNFELEARARERYWFEILNASLNSEVPNRSQKEYCETNKDKIKEWHKEYYEKNKEIIAEQNREYCETNKDKIKEWHKEYYEKNKEIMAKKKKIYRENNKEEYLKYHKNYYKNNKEKITRLITCECGGQFHYSNKSKHLKTKIHLSYIQSTCSIFNLSS